MKRKPGRPVEPIEDRFWRRVVRGEPDECWEWQGSLSKNGYGILPIGPKINRKKTRAHRISWELHRGPIPEGRLVLHICDNKLCVNPNHLYLGTYSDNIRDAWERSQQPRERLSLRGLKHWKGKLSDDDVRDIRKRHTAGESCKMLSKEYGVGSRHIWRVATRRARKYVD